MSKQKLAMAIVFAALLAAALLWPGGLVQNPAANATTAEGLRQALTPAEEAVAYLKGNGYPDAIIELMDAEWRERSYRLQAKFIGAESPVDGDWEHVTDFVSKSLQGQPFQEIIFAEQWNRARTEKVDPIMRIHYFWKWQGHPLWTLNDWIYVASPDESLSNPIALYWPANKEYQGPVEQLAFDPTGNGFLLRIKLKKSWKEDGVSRKADQHWGHISFNCLPRTESNPRITLQTMYHHQRLPTLFSPKLRTDGIHFTQWWAPSFYTNSGWGAWMLYQRN